MKSHKDGQPFNFVVFRPRKTGVNVDIKLPYSEEIQNDIERHKLDDMGYDKKWSTYRLRLTKEDLKEKRAFILGLLQKSYENFK